MQIKTEFEKNLTDLQLEYDAVFSPYFSMRRPREYSSLSYLTIDVVPASVGFYESEYYSVSGSSVSVPFDLQLEYVTGKKSCIRDARIDTERAILIIKQLIGLLHYVNGDTLKINIQSLSSASSYENSILFELNGCYTWKIL